MCLNERPTKATKSTILAHNTLLNPNDHKVININTSFSLTFGNIISFRERSVFVERYFTQISTLHLHCRFFGMKTKPMFYGFNFGNLIFTILYCVPCPCKSHCPHLFMTFSLYYLDIVIISGYYLLIKDRVGEYICRWNWMQCMNQEQNWTGSVTESDEQKQEGSFKYDFLTPNFLNLRDVLFLVGFSYS